MAAPVVFTSQRKRKDSLFGDDNDLTIAPSLGFGADMLAQFPAAARKAMPKDARDMMLSPLGGLSSSLAGLGIPGLGDDDKVGLRRSSSVRHPTRTERPLLNTGLRQLRSQPLPLLPSRRPSFYRAHADGVQVGTDQSQYAPVLA